MLFGKIVREYTGWDFRMWLLAVLTGWLRKWGFIIRKCMGVLLGQRKLTVKMRLL